MKFRTAFFELSSCVLYIIAVICVFWLLGTNHTLLSKWFGMDDTVSLNLDSIASIVGIIAAAMAVVVSNRRDAQNELQANRDQIYQQFELESVNLFRFEIENVELAQIVWEDCKSFDEVQKNKAEAYKVLQHICQILNLFEMALRFKKEGTVHEDVFLSWQAWIYDLCKSSIFLNYWYLKGIRDNYIDLFKEIIDEGLFCAHGNAVEALIRQYKDTNDPSFDTFKTIVSGKIK